MSRTKLIDLCARRRFIAKLNGNFLVELLYAKLIDEPVQISSSESQRARAFRFPPSALAQGPQNEPALELANCIFVVATELRRVAGGPHCRGQLPDFHGQTFG
jgi:hypothetical protein